MAKSLDVVDDTPWYKDGLRFSCTGCGKCCTGSPGYVWINEKEIANLAKTLKISEEEFLRRYTRRTGDRIALLEHPKNYDCVFLKEGRFCEVYESRPLQCRTFPWWQENLESKKSWEEASKRCEGINHEDAPLISFKEIQKQLKADEKSLED